MIMKNAIISRFALTFRRLLPSGRTALDARFCSSITSLAISMVAFVLWAYARPVSAAAVGNAFSYQGRLLTAGGPANGTYDLTFSLYTTIAGGAPMNPRLTNSGVVVANGLFAAELDFGNVFDGTAYWLEVGARTNGAPIFTSMVRQPLIATPNALYARTAQTANSVAAGSVTGLGITASTITADKLAPQIGLWDKSGPNISYSGGNVGIGTANPGYRLTLKGSGNEVYSVMSEDGTQTPDNVTFQIAPGDGSSSTRIGYLFGSFGHSLGFLVANTRNAPLRFGTANTERMRIDAGGNVGIGTASPDRPLTLQASGGNGEWISLRNGGGTNRWHINNSGGGLNFAESLIADGRLFLAPGGNVGIGTTAPSTKLEVAGTIKATGDVKLGAAGQYFAVAGEENLRIVRGGINPDGSIIFGTGFSVTHTNTGIYKINLAQSFSGYHATTATALDGNPTFVTQGQAGPGSFELLVWRNGVKVDGPGIIQFISIGPR